MTGCETVVSPTTAYGMVFIALVVGFWLGKRKKEAEMRENVKAGKN